MKKNDCVLDIFYGMHGFVPDSLLGALMARITGGIYCK